MAAQSSTVLIGAPNHLPALEARLATVEGEKLVFPDSDALRAFDAIVKLKPSVIALERLFAASPRGAALIRRIKADPSLEESEIRVIAHDSDYMRVSPRLAPLPAPPPLDQRGTRRAPRFKIKPSADATVDGQQALIIDLSTVGAQVLSAAAMKPSQRVKVSLADDLGQVRFDADVAWASFEMQPKGPRYRAGLAFIEADALRLEGYCSRHKTG